jgi:preprotein translocase subunit SecF
MYRLRIVPDNTKIQFMKGRIMGLVVSAVLSIASVILFLHPGLNYGLDFKGGILIEARFAQAADIGAIRTVMSGLGFADAHLQDLGAPQDVLIRIEQQPGGDEAQQKATAAIRGALTQKFPNTEIRRVEVVGATVSDELFWNGVLAMGLALLAMLGYIAFRFQWPFGVGAVTTLVLDVTKLVGVYALTQVQFNLTSIAAILTVMGYSINDKVVVYDRMRENLRKYKTMPLRQLVDQSINETLNRTINTSLTVFLATLPLALFARGEVQDFAIIILVGIVIGTSSSIFIAAPILLFLGEGRLRRGAPEVAAKGSGNGAKAASRP